MNATQRIYFDYNASAPLHPAARAAMVETLELTGNASSVHREGRELRKRIEHARGALAAHAGIAPKQVIFTSGASEAAMHALSPRLKSGTGEVRCSRLYVSAIEHPCVLSGGRFDAMHSDPGHAGRCCRSRRAGGIACPARRRARSANGRAHARQQRDRRHPARGAGKPRSCIAMAAICWSMPCRGLAVSTFRRRRWARTSSSSRRTRPAVRRARARCCWAMRGCAPMPLIRGGGQENYHRAGTENVAAIAGFGAAVENLPQMQQWDEIARLRDLLESGLRTISGECRLAAPVVFGAGQARLANTACFAVPGIRAETALISLDLAGIAASSGSACSSGKVKKSHVLEAMSVQDDLAACALRTSLGPSSTMSEVARFLAAWKDMAGRMAKSAA